MKKPASAAEATDRRCACGETARTIHEEIGDHCHAHDRVGFKVKQPGKKDPVLEGLSGDEIRKATGGWVKKDRLIDREHDRYVEHVVDIETGEVLRNCDEPLSEHVGHGSDKPRTGGK
ncbi:MAG: hypothetical protein QM704_21555 [Anaeromyxobacteraceae bacterium]